MGSPAGRLSFRSLVLLQHGTELPTPSCVCYSMKTILLCLLLFTVPFIAAAADVSGKWSGFITPENGDEEGRAEEDSVPKMAMAARHT